MDHLALDPKAAASDAGNDILCGCDEIGDFRVLAVRLALHACDAGGSPTVALRWGWDRQ